MLDKDFEGTEEDYLYGVVTDKPSKSGGSYYATINVFGEGEKDYKIADPANFAKGDVVAFDFNNKGEAVLKSAKIFKGKTLTEYDDGYVTISDSVYKVDSAAILYNKDSDGDLDKKISRSKLKDYEGKGIDFAIEDGILVAAVVYDEAEEDGNGDAAKEITYVSEADGVIVIGDKAYEVANTVILYESDGKTVRAAGKNAVLEALEGANENAIEISKFVVEDGVIKSITLKD